MYGGAPEPEPARDQRVSSFLHVFNALTLRKVLLWGLFIIITGGAYTAYTNRDLFIGEFFARTYVVPTVIPMPKEALREQMSRYVRGNPDVVGLQVVDVDLALNSRTTIWYTSDDPELVKIFDSFLASKIGPTPWLAGSPDFISVTLSSGVNSTSLCVAIQDTPLGKRVQGIDKLVKTLCVVPIPPPSESFSGYISAWLNRDLNEEEKQRVIGQLRIFAPQLVPKRKEKETP